jgi:arylsulfatase A-like enzyme
VSDDELGFDLPREPEELAPVPEARMAGRIALQVAAAGALLGSFEGVVVASRSQLLLTPFERAELGLAAAVADALVALVAGAAGGLYARWRGRHDPLWRRYQRGFGVGWTLVTAFFLAPMLAELVRRQDLRNAAGLAAVSLSVAAFGFLLSGYFYRREMIGLMPRLGFRVPAVVGVVVLAGVSAGIPQYRETPAVAPPPGAPNLVLITIDTLRRDHVGVYGGAVATPNLDRLGREGAIFDAAMTPLPETAPSHASMLTGRHPSETKVVQNGRRLSAAELTVTEQLSLGGWRTGAFLSSFALDSSAGLDQGFEVYDDDFFPALRGVGEFRTGWLALRLLMRFGDPADWPSLLERRGDATVERALAWVDTLPEGAPAFLWVHLFDPHSPYDRHDDVAAVDHRAILADEPGHAYTDAEREALRAQYAAEVAWVDTQVGTLLDGLRARGRLDEAAVLALADHGESLGEHGIEFTHHGVYEPVLTIPMVFWGSRQGWAPGTRVAAPVVVSDVANTLLDYAGVPKLTRTDSVALQVPLMGGIMNTSPALLLGRTDTAWLYGVRDSGGAKYIVDTDGHEEVYDLVRDPGELHNLVDEQPGAVASGRRSVEMLKAHVERAPDGDDITTSMLEQLGYADPDRR